MDYLSTEWLSELEMDDSDFIDQWQHLSSLEDSVHSFTPKIFPSNNNIINPSSTLKSAPQVSQISVEEYEVKQLQQKHCKPCISEKISSSFSISFANPDSSTVASARYNYGNPKFYVKPEVEPVEISYLDNKNSSPVSQIYLGNSNRVAPRNPEKAQDHVLAERKRRERMSQRFVALSAVVPGLKKLNKASVLGGAVNYIKELQERVRKLEEEVKRNNEESVVSVKRPRLSSGYDDGSSSDENFYSSSSDQSLPEIEVRTSEGNVLVRAYCRKNSGIIKEMLSEIERHHLTMVSSSAMPFGANRLHITIIAQMSDHYKMTTKTLEHNLRTAIVNLN